MAIEIEKKYRLTIEQLDDVTQALIEDGADFIGEDEEENVIYGSPNLDSNCAIIRIRNTGKRSVVTFKRRIESDLAIKKQIEYESVIADPEAVAAILRNLGLEIRLIYEKRRRTWKYGGVEVVLDELPFGRYREIEGSVLEIAEAEMRLGIELYVAEHETYPTLTAKFGKMNDGVVEARFAA